MSDRTTGTRSRVLNAVRAAPAGMSVEGLADALGLHANSVRFHASRLQDEGMVESHRQPVGGRGRPRVVYQATDRGSRSGERNYQLLASVLIADLVQIASHPARQARSAGQRWGRSQASDQASSRPRSVLRQVQDQLQQFGFEPQARSQRVPTSLTLHNCPFRELVDDYQAAVCAMHLGLLEGMVERADRGVGVELHPFTTPRTCEVKLTRTG